MWESKISKGCTSRFNLLRADYNHRTYVHPPPPIDAHFTPQHRALPIASFGFLLTVNCRRRDMSYLFALSLFLAPALGALYTNPSQLPGKSDYDYIVVGGESASIFPPYLVLMSARRRWRRRHSEPSDRRHRHESSFNRGRLKVSSCASSSSRVLTLALRCPKFVFSDYQNLNIRVPGFASRLGGSQFASRFITRAKRFS